MTNYRKLAAAIIGLASILAARYGFDLGPAEGLILDAVIATLTAFGVYQLPNNPQKEMFK